MGRNTVLNSNRLFVSLLASTALSGVTPAVAQSLPTGYSTAYGSVGFQRSSGSLTINQSSQNAIVNYNSFSVGRGNSVTFNQPNSRSAILNRVTGNTTSTIAGRISANGQVYLVNPNGIAITKTGVVRVGGGFTASSLGMTDAEFRHARKHFKGGGSSAMVSNAGAIRIGRGGYAALIGGQVRNSGLIEVPMGKVGLGSGEAATLDVSGDGFLQVAIPTRAGGKTVLIQQSGAISSAGGTVILDAATARAAARNAVNISGTIDAHSISGHNGSITIGGGAGGAVQIGGRLNVSGSRHFAGGSVVISGRRIKVSGTIEASGRVGGTVRLAASNGMTITGTIKAIGHHGKGGTITATGLHIVSQGAKIAASGTSGGGTVLIGGNRHGAGPLPNAGTVTIDAKSTITADAIGSGDGGNVVVWSQLTTNFAGAISARGGPNGGNGGQVEVSSHGVLSYTGLTTLTAAQGQTGTLLFDPYNIVISNGTDAGYAATTAGGTTTDTPSGTSVISAATLDAQLAAANVTITTGSSGSDAGNITVAAPITWSSGSLLTLTAANAIAINAPVTIAGAGQLTLNYNTSSLANLSFGLTGSGFTGSVSYAAGSGSGISGQALTINNTSYTLIYNQSELAGLNAAGPEALATSLTSTTNYTNAVVGTFFGTFEGLGNTISNLTITSNGADVGLFSELQSGGTIRDIGLVGGSVSGPFDAGGLVGEQSAGTITQSYATGSVSGSSLVGGLVGKQGAGTITQSYATGSVSGSTHIGGLVGEQGAGTIMQSYATGAVIGGSGSYSLGGLVGEQDAGTITQSYATGGVSGSNGSQYVGGLVGDQSGTIAQSYATGAVNGGSQVGGLVGAEYLGTITQSYATGSVIGGSSSGGLVGNQTSGTTITASYWDTTTSGLTQGVGNVTNATGVSGVTTAGLASSPVLSALNGGGTVFANVGSQTTPYIIANPGPVFLATDTSTTPLAYNLVFTVPQLEAIDNNLSANYLLAQNIDATGYTGFTPIGETTVYTGTFNGLGNTISNLTISTDAQYAGLFGQSSGTIENVGLAGGSVTGTGHTSYAGGLVGYQRGGTIISSYATGPVSAGNTIGGLVGNQVGGTIMSSYATGAVSGGNADGGLVGNHYSGTIMSSYATGTVSGSGPNGGLVGVQNGGTIMSSYATGAVSGGGLDDGGLVGLQQGGTITSSYATGAVSGGTYHGGLVGYLYRGTIASSYWDTATSGLSSGVGYGSSSGVTGVTTAQLASAAVLSALNTGAGGTVFANVNNQTTPYIIANPGPVFLATDASATPAVYNVVLTTAQLQAINTNLSANYVLGQNIDATDYAGFAPIGTSAAPFEGTFDGAGYTIANLTINQPQTTDVGLFGQVSGGTIENVGLIGGSVMGSQNVGDLVGGNINGTIINAYATGAVSGGTDVGGLVGLNEGDNGTASITNAYATGAVSSVGLGGGSLVGYNYANRGTASITNAYATGAVSSFGSGVGGLVGYNEGYYGTASITNAYATGAVSSVGGLYVGGLVGLNEGYYGAASITNAYATGAVSSVGGLYVGGLVGSNQVFHSPASITSGYYDSNTTGQALGTQGDGSVGLTTAQLQSTTTTGVVLGSAFSGGVAGGTGGLYPYLTSFYPTTPQAVSGFAYTDAGATPLASGAAGANSVSVIGNGASLGSATTGANGYYYILAPAGSLASGNNVIAYTSANATGATNAATLAIATSAANQQNVNIYGNAVTVPTAATSLSGFLNGGTFAQAQTAAQTSALAADGNVTAAANAINGATGLGLSAAGAFTIDQPLTTASTFLVQTASGSALTVADAVTVSSGTSLGLLSGGALAIDAPVTAQGTASVALAYNTASAANLSFAQGDALTYTDPTGNSLAGTSGAGGALAINGQAYTLLYSLAGTGSTALNRIDTTGDGGHYALATSLAGTGTRSNPQFSDALAGADAHTFSGTFEGLGNTITNLTITDPTNSNSLMNFPHVGLFGTSNGVIRDIGLVGGSVSVPNGISDVGGLVGDQTGGLIRAAASTVTVSAGPDDSAAGGLVGELDSGTIQASSAGGAVSGNIAGGLVGAFNGGQVQSTIATGAVSSFGSQSAGGGLVGDVEDGTIATSYATGAVSGSGANGTVGGLVGVLGSSGTIQTSYFDTQTTGQTAGLGAGAQSGSVSIQGLTTTQLQGGAATQLGSAFSGGANGLYPYLKSFYPTAPQAISGVAYSDRGIIPLASGSAGPNSVFVDIAGTQTSATTGANGYYYVLEPTGTLAAPGIATLAYTTSDNTAAGIVSGASLITATSTTQHLDIWGSTLIAPTTATSLTGATTAGLTTGTALYNSNGNAALAGSATGANTTTGLGTLADAGYIATSTAGFTVDAAVGSGASTGGGLYVQTTQGPITVTTAQTIGGAAGATNLSLLSGGALAVNQSVTVEGAGSVNLAFNSANPTNLSFAQGAALTYTDASGHPLTSPVIGQALAINGQAYTLLYSLANAGSTGPDTGTSDIAGIDANTAAGGDSGRYALATNVSDGGVTFTSALAGSGNNTFSGTFEGLGNTITGLTINAGGGNYVGLFGRSSGTIRDIGLIGGSVSGSSGVGGLVGTSYGTIQTSYATGNVSGSGYDNGGLVGSNLGTIQTSYATGNVSGSGYDKGGLVGYNHGTIQTSYATGAVSGGTNTGGLVGDNTGAITSSYATGAVGNLNGGGLIGLQDSAGSIMSSYWDTSTSGVTRSVSLDSGSQTNVAGYTTAQLQGLAPISGSTYFSAASQLSSAFAGGTNGLYPYLTSFFPHGVQAVSGIAYSNAGATPLASGAAGANSVSVIGNGASLGSATTGANGYYYILAPAGSLASGNNVIAYTSANATGATNAATLAIATSAANQQNVNIYGNAVTVPTAARSLSGFLNGGTFAQAQTAAQTSALAADGNVTAAANAINGATGLGLSAAGAFTIDQPLTPASTFVVQTATGSALTVTSPITVSNGTSLGLLSGGALAIDAPVTAQGTASVALAYNTASAANLSFAQGDALTYTDPTGNSLAGTSGAGGALTINGQAYKLLYSLANAGSTVPDTGTSDIAGIDANTAAGGDSGRYALATNVSDGGVTFTSALAGSGNNTFSGTFEGLGNTITGLTINAGGGNYVGLFGQTSGTIRDIGLIGGSISGGSDVGALVGSSNNAAITASYATGAVSGSRTVGGLVGLGGGTITASYATGAVSGSSYNVGGLVGFNISGTIQTSYATGAVSGSNYVGGLVGQNNNTIVTSYATGAVSGSNYVGGLVGQNNNTIVTSYATGAVSGSSTVGGLAGFSLGTIQTSYATGAVSGSSIIGGLVGQNNNTIVTSYATGAVSGSSVIGGLVGYNTFGSTIQTSYFDTQTTGQSVGIGVTYPLGSGSATGLTTAQLQGTAALPNGVSVSLGAAFAGGAAGGETNVYPYLTYFDPHGVQAVSGFAYTNGGTTLLASPASGASGNGLPATQRPGFVSAAANGVALGTVTTGANGYYYIVVPAGTLPANTRTATYTVADTGTNGSGAQNAATYVTASGGTNVSGTDIYGGWQFDAAGSSFTTLASLNTADAAAAGGLAPTGVAIANREIVSTAPSFALNAVTNVAGTFVLDATGNVTQSAGVTANALLLEGGGRFTLTSSNTISTLAASGGTIDVDTTGAVTVGTVGDATGASDAGIDATGPVTLISGGAQTLAATGTITSGGAIVLAGKGVFTNAAGANALTPGNAASFTIYSQDPTHPTTALPADVFGGLTATNYYNDAYNFSTGTFASAVPTGNHFVYGYAATLTPLLSGSATKIYNTTNVASLTNLTIGATLLSGNDTATFSFTGANYDTANAGSNKTVTATGISFDTNQNNYVLGSVSASAAIGTIGKATITVAGATGVDKTYDTTTGLVNGAVGFTHTSGLGNDQVIVTAGTDAYASANAGAEAINVSGLTLSGAAKGNYQLSSTSVTGSGTIGKATITVAGATGIDKTYDTTNALTNGAAGFTDTGALGHDQVIVTAGSDAYAGANAGHEAINVSGLTLSGSAAGNYQLSSTSVTGSGTIGKATITVAGATGIDKTYDTTNALTNGAAGFTDTGALGHDQVIVTAGTDAYAGANAGHEAINVSGLTLSGSAAGNYQLSSTSVTGSGTIGKATITVAGATGIDKTYDTTNALTNGAAGFTDTGALGHDQVIVTAGTDAYAGANAGHEAINVSGLTLSGSAAGNYQLSSTSVTGSGTIGKATITVAGATGIDKTYDTTNALTNGAVGFTNTGVLGSDQVNVTAGTDAYAGANAGHEAINVSGLTLSGSAAGNYQLSSTSVTGSGTIGKATITVAGATGIDKTYDTTNALTNGAVGFTNTGALGHDQVIVTAGTDAYAGANAGHEAINVSGLTLSGSAAGNYQLSSTSVTGSGTIGKATITVAGATGIDKTYDTTNALTNGAVGFTNTGVLGSDQVNVTAGSDAYAGANAGLEAINVSGLTLNGSAAGNYQLSSTSVTGSGTIGKATITVAGATGIDKTYDTTTALTNGAVGFTDTGALGSDQVNVTAGSDAYAGANAGLEAINVSGLTLNGSAAGNYQLSSTSVTGSGTIGKATITVAGATGIDKTYDTTTALTNGAVGFTDTGALGHDQVIVTAGSDAYAGANAGHEAINVSGLTLSGSAAGNYQLSSTSVTGSGTIGKATVIVTALGGTSIYGDTPINPGLSATGLQGGQTISVLTGLSNAFGMTGQTSVGAYAVSVIGTLTNANYVVGATRSGVFDVTPRALTITADDEVRAQGFANPPLAYQIGGLGLVNGDHVVGALFTPATMASPIGRYAIDQGTLSVTSNYTVTYVPGTLSVGAAADQSAGTLGSTVDRGLLQSFGHPGDGVPFISSADGEGNSPAEIIHDLGDPHFDETIACVKDICTIVVTRKPVKTTSLEPRP